MKKWFEKTFSEKTTPEQDAVVFARILPVLQSRQPEPQRFAWLIPLFAGGALATFVTVLTWPERDENVASEDVQLLESLDLWENLEDFESLNELDEEDA